MCITHRHTQSYRAPGRHPLNMSLAVTIVTTEAGGEGRRKVFIAVTNSGGSGRMDEIVFGGIFLKSSKVHCETDCKEISRKSTEDK